MKKKACSHRETSVDFHGFLPIVRRLQTHKASSFFSGGWDTQFFPPHFPKEASSYKLLKSVAKYKRAAQRISRFLKLGHKCILQKDTKDHFCFNFFFFWETFSL